MSVIGNVVQLRPSRTSLIALCESCSPLKIRGQMIPTKDIERLVTLNMAIAKAQSLRSRLENDIIRRMKDGEELDPDDPAARTFFVKIGEDGKLVIEVRGADQEK